MTPRALLLLLALCGPALALGAGEGVDVWALRAAVARVEALKPTTYSDFCWPEGSESDAPMTPAQQASVVQAGRACEDAALKQEAAFKAAREQFNAKWRPLLLRAIQRGDVVAEVIWRQCDTTSVLDRQGLESSCAPTGSPEREVAARRLREIGFVPAFDWGAEALRPHQSKPMAIQQQLAQRMAGGDFSGDLYVGGGLGSIAYSDGDVEEIRWRRVLMAAVAQAPQAFAVRDDGSQPPLRLNRHRPVGPAPLTRGPEARAASGEYFERMHGMRRVGGPVRLNYVSPGNPLGDATETVGGMDDPRFLLALKDVMTRADASIQGWLQKDPRWGVFLQQRVAWHDWLPPQMPDERARLDPSWRGEWVLDAAFVDLRREQVAPARARITQAAEGALLQFAAEAGVACRLRYSGGVLRQPLDTLIGNEPVGPRLQRAQVALAPLATGKAYRQVLVQCPQGEWPDSPRMRHLFLAGDVLVELDHDGDDWTPLRIRHWRRAAAQPTAWPTPVAPPLPDTTAVLAQLDAALASNERAQQQLAQGTPAAWMDMLAYSRVTRWPFHEDDVPENMRRLLRTRGNYPALCERLGRRPADPLLRFNLVLALRHEASDVLPQPPREERMAECLRPSLEDAHPWVRAEALLALGALGLPEDEVRLKRFVDDADPALAAQARKALLWLADTQRDRQRDLQRR